MQTLRRGTAVALALLTVLVSASTIVMNARAQPVPMGGYVDEIEFHAQPDPSKALLELDAGLMDVYTAPLRTSSQIQSAQSDPSVRLVDSEGIIEDLFLNPVPIDQQLATGRMNPFAIAEVREAMNYLMDRDYLTHTVLGSGFLAQTAVWHAHSTEYARDPVFFSEIERGYANRASVGRQMIYDALTGAGAAYESGMWYWQGAPIQVDLIVRMDDVRLQIGAYVQDVLTNLGFQVATSLMTAPGAFGLVYSGAPDDGRWQVYTEAWSYAYQEAWPDSEIDFYYNGGQGSTIWSAVGGPYQPPAELSTVATQLAWGLYPDQAARQELVERGTQLALQESVRVWLASGAPYVSSDRVTGYVYDFAGGSFNPLMTRTARLGDAPGGTLRVGMRYLMLSAFNPWYQSPWPGAFADDGVILGSFTDDGVVRNPHTSEPMPLRSTFTVTSSGPARPQAVPADAVRYDTLTNAWVPVEVGTTAVSVVEYTYAFGNWHDGVAMSMDDVQYEMALLLRRVSGDVASHDPAAATSTERAFAAALKGIRILDADTLAVYTDLWHIDPATIAQQASVFPKTPWDVSELAMATVLGDQTRVNEGSASYEGLDALDLVRGNSLGYMDALLPAMKGANAKPPGSPYITDAEANERWSALETWRAAYGHYFVSNGPYYLSAVDEVSGRVTVKNFPCYPFAADRWDSFLRPRVPELALGTLQDVVSGSPASFTAVTSLAGSPDDDLRLSFAVVSAATGSLALQGKATNLAPGTWTIALAASDTALLAPGLYELRALAVGNQASVVVLATGTFRVLSALDTTPPVTELMEPSTIWINAAAVPFTLTATALDGDSGVASVELYFSYQDPAAGWTEPSSLGTRTDTFTWSVDPAPLRGDGSYRFVTVGTDASGNVEDLAAKMASRYLELRVDTAAPEVLGVSPVDGSVKVSASGTTIRIAFSEAMDPTATEGALRITPSLVGTITWDGFTLVFTPTGSLDRGTAYVIRVTTAAADLAGNHLAQVYVFGFETMHRRAKTTGSMA